MNRQICIGTLCLAIAACGGGNGGGEEAIVALDNATTAAQQIGARTIASGEPGYTQGDAKVPGTDYHATTIIKCGFEKAAPAQSCDAGVKRNWNGMGEHLVVVTKPDGRNRSIFFKGTQPYGADGAQADGSAGWDFQIRRDGDQVTISFGPETYVIIDALITGG